MQFTLWPTDFNISMFGISNSMGHMTRRYMLTGRVAMTLLVIEENVVAWAEQKMKVVSLPKSFDEVMEIKR